MHRLLTSLLVLLIFAASAFAIPADPTPFKLKLADGTEVMARVVGDESFSYIVTLDGVPVVKDGNSYHLAPEQKETLKATLRSKFNKRNAPLMRKMRERVAEMNTVSGRRKVMQRPDASKFMGKKYVPVILVNYNDQKLDKTKSEHWNQLNKEGYYEGGHVGSVHDYFYDNSGQTFDLSFDVIGPVTVSKNMSYYGRDEGSERDPNVPELIAEACQLAKDLMVDWSKYDWDNDGNVDQVCVVAAGPSQAFGQYGQSYYVWPHSYELSSPLSLDGDKTFISHYMITTEYAAKTSQVHADEGIGTFCHEFSHCLGLPDFYDISSAEPYNFGMGNWDIMNSGGNFYTEQGTSGSAPTGYTAFERWFFGWMTLTELKTSQEITVAPLGRKNSQEAFVIYKDGNRDEFVIIENRQPTAKWFKAHDKKGLLLYRVNISDKTAWEEMNVNSVYDEPNMTIIPASNTFGSVYKEGMYLPTEADYARHLFPIGADHIDSRSHMSITGKWKTKDVNGNRLFKWSLTNFSEVGAYISCDFTTEQTDEADDMMPNGSKLLYWFDDAPEANVVNYTNSAKLNIDNLDYGVHTLYTQVLNANGYASDVVATPFYKLSNPIEERRWVAIVDGEIVNSAMMRSDGVPTEIHLWTGDLSVGFHKLQMFVYSSTGYQTELTEAYFYNMPKPIVSDVFQMAYKIDDGELQCFTWPSWDMQDNKHFELIDAKGLKNGDHTLYYRIANAEGTLYTEDTVTFNVGNGLIGDVNGDGKVDICDAVQIICVSTGGKVSFADPSAMDLDGSGKINKDDVMKVIKITLQNK